MGRAQPELAEVTEGARHELELGLITSIVWRASSDSSARGHYLCHLISHRASSPVRRRRRWLIGALSPVSNDVTVVHLLEQNSNAIPVWPTSSGKRAPPSITEIYQDSRSLTGVIWTGDTPATLALRLRRYSASPCAHTSSFKGHSAG